VQNQVSSILIIEERYTTVTQQCILRKATQPLALCVTGSRLHHAPRLLQTFPTYNLVCTNTAHIHQTCLLQTDYSLQRLHELCSRFHTNFNCGRFHFLHFYLARQGFGRRPIMPYSSRSGLSKLPFQARSDIET
jgi:hypothetical protein